MARTCSSGGGKNKSHSDADAKQRDKTIFDPRIQPTEPAIFCLSMYYLAAHTHTEDDNAGKMFWDSQKKTFTNALKKILTCTSVAGRITLHQLCKPSNEWYS